MAGREHLQEENINILVLPLYGIQSAWHEGGFPKVGVCLSNILKVIIASKPTVRYCGLWRRTDKELRFLPGWIRFNSNSNTVYLFDCFLCQYFFRQTITINFAVTQHHQARKEKRGEV